MIAVHIPLILPFLTGRIITLAPPSPLGLSEKYFLKLVETSSLAPPPKKASPPAKIFSSPI